MKSSGLLFSCILSILCVIACAKRGSITGGPKDEQPPKIEKEYPKNFSVAFNSREIKLSFDELVTIQNPQQVLISPPMKVRPEFSPVGYPSRTIKVKFKEELLPETTYNINFGSAIVDNNERNPFAFYQYTFSTGKILDSLTFKGRIKDALKSSYDKNVSIHLYEMNEAYTDSIVFKDYPRYIANNQDVDTFEIKHLKAGKYKLVGLLDKANNYLYDPLQDKIGFLNDTIVIPRDSSAVLNLFLQDKKFRYTRIKQASKHGFVLGYEGYLEKPEITLLDERKDSLTLSYFRYAKKDTLKVFVKPFFKQDSLQFLVKNRNTSDTLVTFYKDQYKDSLLLESLETTIKTQQLFKLTATTPITKFDENKATLFVSDSLVQPFETSYDADYNYLAIKSKFSQDKRYRLEVLPNAVTDFLDNTNKDTLSFNFETLKEESYGILNLTFDNLDKEESYILQLLQENTVVYEKILDRDSIPKKLKIIDLLPGDYQLRVIHDLNRNSRIDMGSFIGQIQPEPVYYIPSPITVRANWEVDQLVHIGGEDKKQHSF